MRSFSILFFVIILLTPTIRAMSNNSGDDIPVPLENFQGEILDIDGIVTKGFNLSFNGQTYVSATRGATQIYIPFERIQRVESVNIEDVITKEKESIQFLITLVDGTVIETEVRSRDELTGEASFGKFRLRMDHIRSIEVKAVSDKKPLSSN